MKRTEELTLRSRQHSDDDDGSFPRRRHSSGDEYSDDSEDDKPTKAAAVKSSKKQAELVDLPQLKDMMVTRLKLAEFCAAPWFEEWVKGEYGY